MKKVVKSQKTEITKEHNSINEVNLGIDNKINNIKEEKILTKTIKSNDNFVITQESNEFKATNGKDINVIFSSELNTSNVLALEKENNHLDMKFLGKKSKLKTLRKCKGFLSNNILSYDNFENGMDLKYNLKNNLIKESIIIKEKQDDYTFEFEINKGNLDIFYNKENETIELKDKEKTIFTLLSPYMEDNNKVRSDDCSYTVEENDNLLKLTLKCSTNWINSEERVFPVVIDPTILILDDDILNISSWTNGRENYSYDNLAVGHNSVMPIYEFDNSIKLNIDLNLLMKKYKRINELIISLKLFKISEKVDETTTFIISYNNKIIDTFTIANFKNELLIPIGQFLNPSLKNIEIVISKQNDKYYDFSKTTRDINPPSEDGCIYFYSKFDEEENNRPSLLIEYENEKTIENSKYKIKYPTVEIGTSYIDAYNVTYQHRVINEFLLDNQPIDIENIFDPKFYNKDNLYGLGKGWKTNYHQYIVEKDNQISYIDSYNIEHTFDEKYFYVNNDGEKIYVPKKDVFIEENGKLKYLLNTKEFDVTRNYDNNEGLNLILKKGNNNCKKKQLVTKKKRFFIQLLNDLFEIEYVNGMIIMPYFTDNNLEDVSSANRFLQEEYYDLYRNALESIGNYQLDKNFCKCLTFLEPKKVKNLNGFFDENGTRLTCYYEDVPLFKDADGYYVKVDFRQYKCKVKHGNEEKEFYARKAYSDSYSLGEIRLICKEENVYEYVENDDLFDNNDYQTLIINKKTIQENVSNLKVSKQTLDIELNLIWEKYKSAETYVYIYNFDKVTGEYVSALQNYENIEMQYKTLRKNIATYNDNINKLECQLKNIEEKINDYKIDEINYVIFNGNNFLGFDGTGKLIQIQTDDFNKIEIKYDNKRILCISSNNKKIIFNYNEKTNLLESIIDAAGRIVSYNYNLKNNDLINIIKCDNTKINFNYFNGIKIESNNEKTEITINNESSIAIKTFYTSNEISKNTNITNNEFKIGTNNLITYDGSKTKLEDIINSSENIVYNFNDNKKISTIDDKKCVKYYLYDGEKILFYGENRKKDSKLASYSVSDFISSNINIVTSNFVKNLNENKLSTDNFLGLKITIANSSVEKFGVEIQNQIKIILSNLNPNESIIIPIKINRNISETYKVNYTTFDDFDDTGKFKSIELVNIYNAKQYYYIDDKILKEEDATSNIVYEYNKNNLCIKTEETNIYNDKLVTNYSYNSNNQLTLSEDSKKNIVEYYYDENGICIEQRSYNKEDASLMKIIKTKYDEKGNIFNYGLIKNKDGNYPVEEIKYCNLNTEIKGLKNDVIVYNYDLKTSELLSISSSACGINNSTSFTYNYGLLTSMKHLGCEVEYIYDWFGRKLKTLFNGKEILWTTYKDNYNSAEDDNYDFDTEIKNGSCVETTTADGYYEAYYKNDENNLIYKKYSADDTNGKVEYTYENDKIVEIKYIDNHRDDGSIYKEQIKNEYKNGLIVKQNKIVNDQINLTIQNNYNNNYKFIDSYDLVLENETRLNYRNTYVNDLLTSVTLNDAIVDDEETFIEILKSEYKYDTLNRVQHQKITSNKVNMCHEYSYLQQDNNSLDLISDDILKIEIDNNNQKSYLSETHTYEYDVNGNITSIADDEIKNRYEYDELNRLIREDNKALNKTVVYKYDKAGNILLKKNYNYNLSDIIPLNKPKNINEYIYDCDNRDRLISFDGKIFEYDDMGRPTMYKNNELEWNNKGQLLLYINENLDEFEYRYDSNGVRNKKIINGKETIYITNGTQIMQMKNDNGKFIFHYILNKLVGFEYTSNSGTREYLYIRNIQGDITSIIDTEGNIICTYTYDGYGNHIVLDENGKEDTSLTSIGHLNPFRYRGYYFDEESGLYYLNSRYYDPETGRFISPDVLSILDETKGQINGLNLYMYCNDNPIMFYDPNGNAFLSIVFGMAIGFAIGGVFEIGKQIYENGWNPSDWDWKQIGLSALGGGAAGAISSIPINNVKFLGYFLSFLTGGTASVIGGLISGSVNSIQTGIIAFTIGGLANVLAKGVTEIAKNIKINKQVISKVRSDANKISNMSLKKKSLKIWDLIGMDNYSRNSFKTWNANDIFNLLVTEASVQTKINAIRNLMRYSVYSSIISSLASGWY